MKDNLHFRCILLFLTIANKWFLTMKHFTTICAILFLSFHKMVATSYSPKVKSLLAVDYFKYKNVKEVVTFLRWTDAGKTMYSLNHNWNQFTCFIYYLIWLLSSLHFTLWYPVRFYRYCHIWRLIFPQFPRFTSSFLYFLVFSYGHSVTLKDFGDYERFHPTYFLCYMVRFWNDIIHIIMFSKMN